MTPNCSPTAPTYEKARTKGSGRRGTKEIASPKCDAKSDLIQGLQPAVDFFANAIAAFAIAFLKNALELLALSIQTRKIVVRQLTHCSRSLPVNCFQLPSTRFQSIAILPRLRSVPRRQNAGGAVLFQTLALKSGRGLNDASSGKPSVIGNQVERFRRRPRRSTF